MNATGQGTSPAMDAIRARGESVIVEPEGYPLLVEHGIACPRCLVLTSQSDLTAEALSEFPGHRVVVKIASPEILHRSDVGGVAIVEKRLEAVREALA